MIETLQEFTAGFPVLLQWLAVMLVAAIPFVESYLGSVVGVVAGLPAPIAIGSAIIGNIVSMLAVVFGADALRSRFGRNREVTETPKRQRLRRTFDKWGVPGVSLLGQTILPSQITSGAMVSFGASRRQVVIWQIVSIIVWGVAFGTLASLGLSVAR